MTRGRSRERCAIVLQGGGALGAYQAGAFETLAAVEHVPDWVAGVSIGAINAALIAGNAPEDRVARLKTFWERVSSSTQLPPWLDASIPGGPEAWSASQALAFGVPGFFAPRFPPTEFWSSSARSLSYYDTGPLHETLLELIDFDRLNDGEVRCSLGAVDVASGNSVYFDTRDGRIDPEHVMASGALPPGFPAVEIGGRCYWDGGLVSNTPLQYVLDENLPQDDLRVFQVDLFSARGALPTTLSEIAQREKDIRFSSRTRLNTDAVARLQTVKAAAHRLAAKLPSDLKDDPDAMFLSELADGASVAIVHLIHRQAPFETDAKDYEFSRRSVERHWRSGGDDARAALASPRWNDRRREPGVQVFDATRATDLHTE